MRIVHISDIHLSANNLSELRTFYLRALLEDLRLFHQEKRIDVVVISGDLIDKGGESFAGQDAYAIFEKEFIRPIMEAFDIPSSNILFVPGTTTSTGIGSTGM